MKTFKRLMCFALALLMLASVILLNNVLNNNVGGGAHDTPGVKPFGFPQNHTDFATSSHGLSRAPAPTAGLLIRASFSYLCAFFSLAFTMPMMATVIFHHTVAQRIGDVKRKTGIRASCKIQPFHLMPLIIGMRAMSITIPSRPTSVPQMICCHTRHIHRPTPSTKVATTA